MEALEQSRRILIVDDTRAIHQDFRKILGASQAASELDGMESALFGEEASGKEPGFVLDSAYQGEEALELFRARHAAGEPHALAFVDMRMPPGWDGIQTIQALWLIDPALQVVICSAYSDHSWSELTQRLDAKDRLLILKKPFDNIEVVQLAHALTQKWALQRSACRQRTSLEEEVRDRTLELQAANEGLRQSIKLQREMELTLRLGQKLEAVGRLASGVAHEINTPVQYVSDSIQFVGTSIHELGKLLEKHQQAVRLLLAGEPAQEAAAEARTLEETMDLPYLLEQVPRALDRSLEGLRRISTIVTSMQEFAHPDQAELQSADLNRALESTLTIARNEYKYVADLETSLGEVPQVMCNLGEINQALLNLIVNAAHAISDVVGESGRRGTIRVATAHEAGKVRISISDTGTGIPLEIRDRIFDPFFTTKEVGRGTGQGLAVARSVIERHSGELTFESELGKGTTFTVRLPAAPDAGL